MSNPTLNVSIGSIDISPNAFASAFQAALTAANISGTNTINLVITIGAGVTSIAEGAFTIPSGGSITISNASIVFATRTASQPVTIGANAFGNLPVNSLALPASTTLQPNSLTNLTHLTNLDVSALTTPLASNSLNLTRSTTGTTTAEAPLIVLMPTAAVSYSSNAVVLPSSTSTSSTTTVVFNGSVPTSTQLQTMFTPPATSAAPVQVAINYETTSSVSAEQITALRTALTSTTNTALVPQAVSYTSVLAAIAANSTSSSSLGTLTGISQFAGDYFNYLKISATECIVSGLTPDAIRNNVATIPVPAAVTPKDTPNSSLNVVAIASRLSLHNATNVFYVFDNYYDETVSNVPLVALVNSTKGISTENANFIPAIVCNGVINVSEVDGTVSITGSTATVNGIAAYCVGYVAGGVTPTTLLTVTSGLSIYDKGNSNSIGNIFINGTTFTIKLNAVKENALSATFLNGAFQSNTAITSVDFTNMAHSAQMTWNSFSTAVGAVISTNNSLSTLIAQVIAYSIPSTVSGSHPVPTITSGNNTIVNELSALNSSNTNVLSNWKAVTSKYANYSAYVGLTATSTSSIYKYVSDVSTALAAGVAQNPDWASASNFFNQAKTSLATYVTAMDAALNATSGTLKSIVTAYQLSRFQMGNQTFRSCTSILNIVAFELLQNLVKVNIETFYGCSSIQTSIAIPKNVVTIDTRAFWVCAGISGLNLQNASALRTIGNEAFKSCNGLRGSLSFSSSVYAQNSVETIGDYAFSGCSGLTDHLYFPPGLKSLGVGAFQDCSGLNGTIVFPSNANFTIIPDNAFARCSSLTGISSNTGNNTSLQYLPITGSTNNIPNGLLIPASVVSIGASAFTGCVKFAGALDLQTGRNIQKIGVEAFKNCAAFTSLLLPNVAQYNTIDSNCFNGCSGFTSVNFPSNVTSILDGAFRGCSNIASKLNLDNVQYIWSNAFNGCSSLSGALTLGAYLYVLGDNAFFDCPKINSVTFLGAPTKNIATSALIFGLTVPSNVKLYINVFVENGWTALLGSAGTLRISSVFRNAVNSGAANAASIVQTSLIDFTIPTPATHVTDVTIQQFQGFTVLTNNGTSGDNLAIQTQAADPKQWVDVCIPGALKGYNAATGDTNSQINQATVSTLTTLNSLIDTQQTDSYYALQAALNVSTSVNGTNISIEAGSDFSGIVIKEITLPYTTSMSDVLPFYGVVNSSGVNKLYYATAASVAIGPTNLVTTVGANVQFYVKTATGTNATQYANKVIQVDSTGAISISRLTVIGYNNSDGVKVNDASTSVPTSSTKGYTIVANATLVPTLYFYDRLADARAYYMVLNGGGVNGGTGTGLTAYTSTVFYVNYQGVIYSPAFQQKLTYVAVANEVSVGMASTNANTYSIVAQAPATNPGNTSYTLYMGNGNTAPVAQAGSHYIKTSSLGIFNETIVSVTSTGGISIGSFGLTGASNAFTHITQDLSTQSIPIYTDNQKYINLNEYVKNNQLPQAVSEFDASNKNLTSANTQLSTDNASLTTAVTKYSKSLPAGLIAANTATNVKVAAFIASAPLSDNSVDASYTLTKSDILAGNTTLAGIQTTTLATINDFITKSNYAAAAASASSATQSTALTLAYLQTQIETYAVSYLTYQYNNKLPSFPNSVEAVNNTLLYSTKLTRIEKNLADYAALILTNWLTGGNNSWQSLYNLQPLSPATSVSAAQYLTWFQTNVATPLTTGGNTVYQQFLTARPVPTLQQVATAIAAYETSRLVPANDATANLAAQAAYIAGGVYPNASVHDKTDVGVCAKSVYDAYYVMYGPNLDISGIKNYMKYLATTFSALTVTLSTKCATLDTNGLNLIESVDSLNVAYDQAVVAESNAYNLTQNASDSITEQLNGIRARLRMDNLFAIVLNNPSGGASIVPAFSTLPDYESAWYKSQLDAFVALTADKTVATASTAYTAATTALLTKKEALQVAEINSFFANYPPSSDVVSPVTQTVVRDNVFKCLTTINAFLPSATSTDLLFVQNVVSPAFIAYVAGRDAAIGTQTGANRLSAITAYQQSKIAATGVILTTARAEYGVVLYKQYLAAIYLIIAQLYNSTTISNNAFKTAVQSYTSPPQGQLPLNYFPTISSFVYGQLYINAYTGSYSLGNPTVQPYVLFGDTTNITMNGGQLYRNLNNSTPAAGFQIASDITNTAVIPMTAYGSNTGAGLPISITLAQYATGIIISNNANIALANAALQIVGSYEYKVTVLENAPVPDGNGNSLFITGTDNKVYDFLYSTIHYYGYEQSAALNNSWANLSSGETVVFLYQVANTADNLALLLSASKTGTATFVDDAKYVMVIKPAVAPATGKTFMVYTYNTFGVSGEYVRNGTIDASGVNASVAGVTGPFQTASSNYNVSLMGDLVISNQIKTVGVNAFASSSTLKSVSFANGANAAVSIGSNAFANCTGLTSVTLGPTISSIGPSAFLNCSGLTSIILPSNPSFTVIDHFVFNGCINLGNATNGNLVIPAAVTQINVQSFAGCVKLVCQQLNGVSSHVGPNLKKIGFGAFLNCIGLTGPLNLNNILNSVGTFNSSLTFVGTAAFMGCKGFNGALSVPINPAYVNILPYTFASMDAPLLSVLGTSYTPTATVPNSPYNMNLTGVIDLTSTNLTNVGRCAFHKCSLLEGVVLSSVVSDVGNLAFKSCSGLLGALTVPASVKTIGSGAFQDCVGITGLSIVSTMVSQTATTAWLSIGSSAFQGCSALSNSNTAQGLYIPNTVSSIGDSAFQNCINITSVTVGSGLTAANAFGKLVFSGCTKLARVVLAFSFLSTSGAGAGTASVVSGVSPASNNSFTDCTALGVVGATQSPSGTVQIQSGATGWTPGRAAFFNYLTVVITNKNINFYLKQFNQNITVVDPSKDSVVIEPLPITDAQANVYVKASDMRKVFRTSTDSFMNHAGDPTVPRVDHGQMFFVLPEYFPKYLNVANAVVSQGGVESYNSATYEQLVKDDVMRYYAISLFQSADWVTLFANDVEMLENMVASSGLMPVVPDGDVDAATGKNQFNTGALYNIMQLLNSISYTTAYDSAHPYMVQATNVPTPTSTVKWWAMPDTVLPEQGNIGKKLFDMISRNDPGRISSMVQNGSTPMELPFLAGDKFIFVFTLNGKTISLPGMDAVVVKPRTYMIKMILTDDFNSGTSAFSDHAIALYQPPTVNQNVLPVGGAYVADYMYSNYDLHLAIKPSLAASSSDSVYGKVTSYGSYEPIQNVPLALQPFTGWYYLYSTNSQAIQLDFTPKDAANIIYRDMRYLSAYVYFPTAWTSTTVKPSENNFPYWTVVFATASGSSTVTLNYAAKYLTTGGDVVDFLGQSKQFDYSNNHIQLLAPFDMTTQIDGWNSTTPSFNQSVLNGNNGATPPVPGSANPINGTDIWVQKSTVKVVNGLRQPSSSVGPFSFPPVARGYQCIPMPTTDATSGNPATFNLGSSTTLSTALKNNLTSLTSTMKLKSVTLNINMRNSSGYVPSIIVKSVEVVAKNYEAYYLAPMDPNP